MIDEATALIRQEYRIARRLARLFRIERSGGFARRPAELVRRVAERRGAVIDELMRLDAMRRSLAPWATAELDIAMGALRREIDRAEQRCRELLAELGAELERRRGLGTATGLRDRADGRLLGSV
ncbi:MAG: hypothetical protein WAV02_24500 [Stellaceae bacterium]